MIALGKLGSTEFESKICFAFLSFAKVNPPVLLSVIALPDVKEVDVLPVSPVYAVPVTALIISSNYVIVIFLIITSTYRYVVQTISSPVKVSVFRGHIIVSSMSSR